MQLNSKQLYSCLVCNTLESDQNSWIRNRWAKRSSGAGGLTTLQPTNRQHSHIHA